MSDAVVLTCPRCGAGIERAWGAVQAQCHYCGTIVDLPRAAPQVALPPPAAQRQPAKPNYSAMFGPYAISALVIALVILATSGVGLWQARSAAGRITRTVPTTAFGTTQPHLFQGQEALRVNAPNLKSVDPTTLVREAAASVRQRDSQCELTYAYIGEFAGASLDTTGSSSLMRFSCHHVDRTKPPGQDVSDDEWSVRILQGFFTLQKSNYGDHNNPPWREPTCPYSQAWAAAVSSGLPANALVLVYYENTVWALIVQGHPEYSRKINGSTCRVVR